MPHDEAPARYNRTASPRAGADGPTPPPYASKSRSHKGPSPQSQATSTTTDVRTLEVALGRYWTVHGWELSFTSLVSVFEGEQ